jgi:hypothetical protein
MLYSSVRARTRPLLQFQSLPMQRFEDIGLQSLRHYGEGPRLGVGQWEGGVERLEKVGVREQRQGTEKCLRLGWT